MVERYTDWTHTRVLGAPREAGAPYVGAARKLLGEVFEQAAFNNLGTHKLQRRLDDGTVIVAEKHGDIPRMTIIPVPRPAPPEPVPGQGDIVLWARTLEWQAGIRAEKAQQIIRTSSKWSVYAFNGDIDTGRSDGTYIDTFPDGIEHAGNIDWVSGSGVRINWYGPSLRYWYDCYRRPGMQYASKVFLNGAVLLDIAAYATANDVEVPEQYVLGAALVGAHLYVMQGRINEFKPYESSDYPSGADYAWITPPYPDGTTDLRLARYTVTRNDAAAGNADKYSIADGSMATLWTKTGRGLVNPWVFSPTAETCETFAMPDELRHVYIAHESGGVPQDDKILPSASSEHVSLAIDHENDTVVETVSNLSIDNSLGYVIGEHQFEIAADYSPAGDRIPLYFVATPLALERPCYLKIGDTPRVTLAEGNVFCDLRLVNIRDGTIALNRSAGSYPDINFSAQVYLRGALVANYPFDVQGSKQWLRRSTNKIFSPSTPFGHFADDWPTINAPVDTVSPLCFVAGVHVFSSTYFDSPPERRSGFYWPLAGKHYECFRLEVSGRAAYWTEGGNFTAPVPLSALSGSWYTAPVDKDGMRVGESMAADDAGTVLASTFMAISPRYDATIFFSARQSAMGACSTGEPLASITGVIGATTPIVISGGTNQDTYDARYSTIWKLGKWPLAT